jgi:integrase
VKLSRPVDPKLPVPLPAQVQQLIRGAEEPGRRNPYLAGVILMAAATGMRRGELCGLQFDDVDLDLGQITVNRAVWDRGKEWGLKLPKSHQVRTIAVHPELVRRVVEQRWARYLVAANATEMTPTTDAFVWSRDEMGTIPLRPNGVTLAFYRLAKELGIDCRYHDLRRFAGTEMVAAGPQRRRRPSSP